MNVGKLAAFTLLIKKVTEVGSFRGRTPLQESEIDKLVDDFERLKNCESILLKVKSGHSNILKQKRFNEYSFTLHEAI